MAQTGLTGFLQHKHQPVLQQQHQPHTKTKSNIQHQHFHPEHIGFLGIMFIHIQVQVEVC
jgi:hypothetical protein